MVAEEYAMLDKPHAWRFIAGFVRGIGAEYHAMGINPAQSQERFGEAHDLIIRAWTERGRSPTRASISLQLREPLAAALPEPAPADLVPSQGSSAPSNGRRPSLHLCAERSRVAWWRNSSDVCDEAHKAGYDASPDQLAWSNTIYVAETDRRRCARRSPISSAGQPLPQDAGRDAAAARYSAIDSMKRVRAHKVTGKTSSIEDLVKTGVVIVGSPNTVREKLANIRTSRASTPR